MNKKSDKIKNPEIRREKQEKRRVHEMYSDDREEYGMTLYPGTLMASAASSTESTGLIQVLPLTPDMLEAYDEVYSYRRSHPTAEEK